MYAINMQYTETLVTQFTVKIFFLTLLFIAMLEARLKKRFHKLIALEKN